METKKVFPNELNDNWIDKTWCSMLIYTFMDLISFELQNAELKQFVGKWLQKLIKWSQYGLKFSYFLNKWPKYVLISTVSWTLQLLHVLSECDTDSLWSECVNCSYITQISVYEYPVVTVGCLNEEHSQYCYVTQNTWPSNFSQLCMQNFLLSAQMRIITKSVNQLKLIEPPIHN